MDPGLQAMLTSETSKQTQAHQSGAGLGLPWPFNIIFRNSFPQNDLSPSVLAGFLGNSTMPKWSGLFNIGGRVLNVLAFKGSQPWQPGAHAPNFQMMSSGHNGLFTGDFMKLSFENSDFNGRGVGAAMYAMGLDAGSISATNLIEHNGGVTMTAKG